MSGCADGDTSDGGHVTLVFMSGRDPELTVDLELRNTRDELAVYEAIGVAANDAHGTLETMLTASDSEAARHALQQQYGFTEVQSVAVMDMQFRRLTAATGRRSSSGAMSSQSAWSSWRRSSTQPDSHPR
jgi:hypothetical protein